MSAKKQRAIATFDCTGDTDQELTFNAGAILVDVSVAPEEGDGWYSGRIENSDKVGLFPGNYVRFVTQIAVEDEASDDDVAAVSIGMHSSTTTSRTTSQFEPKEGSNRVMDAYANVFRNSKEKVAEKVAVAKEKMAPQVQIVKEKTAARMVSVQEKIAAMQQRTNSFDSSNSLGMPVRASNSNPQSVPLRPTKPLELMASAFKSKQAAPSLTSTEAPWMSQVTLKPVNGAPTLPPRDENDPFLAITSSSKQPTSKRAPPPPPPTTSSATLSSKLASMGVTPTTQLQPHALPRAKPPPPPPPVSKSTAKNPALAVSAEHLKLYECAFAEFWHLFHPQNNGIVDVDLSLATLSSKQVRTIWMRSKLDSKTLGRIWFTVVGGSESRSALMRAEFCQCVVWKVIVTRAMRHEL
ncbi:hypothetical protein BJ741DRAFT_582299 [Chytriomyces cf. hyalinus JEL632]|nr:hypothetical protein BJ741DRAFT_582299 [Chytriomyces cf. hyalinus JEL632]